MYTVQARASSPSAGPYFQGDRRVPPEETAYGTVWVPNTKSYDTFTTTRGYPLRLLKGTHTLKVFSGTGLKIWTGSTLLIRSHSARITRHIPSSREPVRAHGVQPAPDQRGSDRNHARLRLGSRSAVTASAGPNLVSDARDWRAIHALVLHDSIRRGPRLRAPASGALCRPRGRVLPLRSVQHDWWGRCPGARLRHPAPADISVHPAPRRSRSFRCSSTPRLQPCSRR